MLIDPLSCSNTSAMDLLYRCRPKELDNFIFQNLQPNNKFNKLVGRAIDTICDFLKCKCFKDAPLPQPKVLKIVKGGSSGKGTALKGGSDADLVLFLDIFTGYKDQETSRSSIILEIRRRLEECLIQKDIEIQIETLKRDNPRVLSFQLRSSDDSTEYIDFDVLPAFDALGHYKGGMPDPQVYIRLIDNSDGCGGHFSSCFTELQKDFIKERPVKLKSLIRLVKYWYKQLPYWESKPPQYALELLAVYAWEQNGEKTDFDMAQGFQTVLWLIQQYGDLCIFWTKYYDFQNETLKQYLHTQLRKPRPVILDPADPTGIVGEGKRWNRLAQEAADCARQACFRKPDGSMVEPWDVPVSSAHGASFRKLPRDEALCTQMPLPPVLLQGGQQISDDLQALQLNVKLQQYSLDTFASKTVWDFKLQVAQKTGISPYQQKLACQSNGNINLQDSDQLSKFGLKSGDTLLLVVKSEESIPIFLHIAKGQTKSYLVMPSDLVNQFKARIQQQENIQADQFWLTYEGEPLDDYNKLSHYNIAPNDTVYLNVRHRGCFNLGGGPA